MEKTKIKMNICGVEIAVAADAEPEAAQRIADAVRTRMQEILVAPYKASIEKAAVITAMNLCEELARCKAALADAEEKLREAEAQRKEAGSLAALKSRLAQTEAKLKIAEAQLGRQQAEDGGAEEHAASKEAKLRNPVRPELDEQVGLVSFFAKDEG